MYFFKLKLKKILITILMIVVFGVISSQALLAATPNLGFEYNSALTLGTRDLRATVMQVINILMGFLGIIAVIIMLYGGFVYMTSVGDDSKIETAKKILINGAVGLALILGSYGIAFFVVNSLLNATGGGQGGNGVVCNNDSFCDSNENCNNCANDCGACIGGGGGSNFAVSVDPRNNENNVALCRLIQAQFSLAPNQTIDPNTITSTNWTGNFTVDATTAVTAVNLRVTIPAGAGNGTACTLNNQCSSGVCNTTCQGDLVPGVIELWNNNRGLTFNNSNDFESSTTYQVLINSNAVGGLKNSGGSSLSNGDYTATFTTGTLGDTQPPKVLSVFPVDASSDVCLVSPIEAIFNEPMDVQSLLLTDTNNPMDPNSINSLYINPAISGFNKSISGSATLIAKPKNAYTASTNGYAPTLDADVIRDSCGNYLDGNGDGTAGDNKTWSFDTGVTAQCTPQIDSITQTGNYYNNSLTINGHNFSAAGSVFLNNGVEVVSGGSDTSCFDTTYIPNQDCISSWTDDTVQVKLPASGGVSNGALTGPVKIEVGSGNLSNSQDVTINSPHINNIWPVEGGTDQFITLNGVNFGASKTANDHIYFRRDENNNGQLDINDPAETIEANLPCAASVGWADNKLVISVPNNASFTDGETWLIQAVRDKGSSNYWSNITSFTFRNITPGPGICSVINTNNNSTTGVLDDPIQFSGVRFAGSTRDAFFGNYSSSMAVKNVSSWVDNTIPNTVNGAIPNLVAGEVGAFLKIDGKNSNIIPFTIGVNTSGPHIDYFEPNNGPVGEYVVIHGSGFGNSRGANGTVKFNGVDGDFVFPTACSSNYWSDNQIIVKVPTSAVIGQNLIAVRANTNLTDDTSDLALPNFTVTVGAPKPGICKVSPINGPVGGSIDIFGERLNGATAVTFFNNKTAASGYGITAEKISGVVIPTVNQPENNPNDDAVTGPLTVTTNAVVSNSYNFQVFDCRSSSGGCGAIGYSGFECCYNGGCSDPATGGCNNPTKAVYAWNFSTGAYATCGGYSLNQCTAAQSCPNSPGTCSPSTDTIKDLGIACDKSYCDTTYTTACNGNSCNYANNNCVSNADTCDASKAASTITSGLIGTAQCTKVDTENVWQLNPPCQAGTFLDTNGKCTLGTVVDKKTCDLTCADGFNCQTNGSCIKPSSCPSGSTCDGGTCKQTIKGECSCCCRVGQSATDCCVGLTCENADCGTDDAVNTYGFCTGCAVWNNNTFYQDLSDKKCGCKSNTKVCLTDEAQGLSNDQGFCGDCETINSSSVSWVKQGECQSHSACCWNPNNGSCNTCGSLEVIEQPCDSTNISYPSPYKDTTDGCLNSNILAKFNFDLDATTLTAVKVNKCNNGNNDCTTVVTPNTNYPQLVSGDNTSFLFQPSSNFTKNSWYQVTVDHNLLKSSGATGSMQLKNDYTWKFKTADSDLLCKPDAVTVTPPEATLTLVNATQDYSALPVKNCNILTGTDYDWLWTSSIISTATISSVDSNSDSKIDPDQTAIAQTKDGVTTISAKTENITGTAKLTVLLESPKIIGHWPDCGSACINATVGAKFNLPMSAGTLNTTNVSLNKIICGNGIKDAGEDCDDGNNQSGDGCDGICLNEGLIGYWTFDEGTGLAAGDSAGGNDGALVNGVNWVDGKFGKAADFDGSSGYIDIPNALKFNFGDGINDRPFTFAAWIKRNSITDRDTIISKFDNQYLQYFFSAETDGSLMFILFDYDGLNDYRKGVQTSNFVLNNTSWHYVTATYDGSSKVAGLKLYVDGVLQATNIVADDSSYLAMNPTTAKVRIGRYTDNGGGGEFFSGLIDDVRIYNSVLTDTQINDLMNQQNNLCGNGKVDKGEECDSNPFPAGCDTLTCLHTGSVAGISICGDGIVGVGEECDGGAGCSSICLNDGRNELETETITINYVNDQADISLTNGNNLEKNSFYRVLFSDAIVSSTAKPLDGLNYDLDSNGTNDNFSWTFKTKDQACAPSSVKLDPAQKSLYSLNSTQGFAATPYSSPDDCNSSGQKLNPDDYNWNWSLSDEKVATLTNVNNWPLCGNGRIEQGEDCDGQPFPQGCDATTCLHTGSVANISVCNDGVIGAGEDCDDKPFPAGCDINTCLHIGSVPNVSICSNGIIESGEDCDDSNLTSNDGCSSACLNEGTVSDANIDFYQTATSKSPGTTDVIASVDYCSTAPDQTCVGGALSCPGSTACQSATGTAQLEVVCGFANDNDCSKGVCVNSVCTNNSSITTCNNDADCDKTATTSQTCNFDTADHNCSSLPEWGGTCSTSNTVTCYNDTDCPTAETCQPLADCNYCYNNSSIECRADVDCQIGVGYDSCCYRRPQITEKFPDPNYFDPLTNALALDCNNNANSITTDDYCSAFNSSVICQTYTCNAGQCSAYGKCSTNQSVFCLTDNDCPAKADGSVDVCDKTCTDNADCNDITCGACRNAQVSINFNQKMNPTSFTTGGVCSNNSSKSCSQNSECGSGLCLPNIRLGVKYDDSAINQKNCPSGYYAEPNLVYQTPKTWIGRALNKITTWFNNILGQNETVAAPYWCVIPGQITSFNTKQGTTAIFSPQGLGGNNLLTPGLTYRVTVKKEVKSDKGVGLPTDVQYSFVASDTECQVKAVNVYVSQ